MAVQVNPEAVITQLSLRIGQLHTEIAMRDVALDELQKQLDEATAAQAEPTPPKDSP